MKKYIAFMLALIMLAAAGCAKQPAEPAPTVPEVTIPATEPPTEPPTEAPTEPKPVCADAGVQVDKAPAILKLLNRGDVVDVIGDYDEAYSIVKLAEVYGLVEKQLLRLSTAEPYETWTGYAHYNALVYAGYQLQGEPVYTLKTNETVEVLEELTYCYMIQTADGLTGFVPKDMLSRSYITYGGKSSGGGGGGGQDGGDISLRHAVISLSMIEQSGTVTGKADILVDGAPLILGFFSRGDLAPVVTEEGFAPSWDGYYTLYLNGLYAYLPMNLAQLEGDEAFQQWEGFTGYTGRFYDNYLMLGEYKAVGVNTPITILWDGGSFYLASTADGALVYVVVDQVGTTRFATGGGGRGNGGGGGQEWSDPVL